MTRTNIITEAKAIIADVARRFPEYEYKLRHTVVNLSDRLKTTAGKANHRFNMIILSVPIFTRPENIDGFRDTVLHEIAHLLTPGMRHNAIWQSVARRIGGTAERCHTLACERRRGERHKVTCLICGKPMILGPTQYNRYLECPIMYKHKKC